jgi:hypothetical protein
MHTLLPADLVAEVQVWRVACRAEPACHKVGRRVRDWLGR